MLLDRPQLNVLLAAQRGLTQGSPQPLQHTLTLLHSAAAQMCREETKEPHSKGDLETSTAFHKKPKGFRICFQMNKPDVF